MAQKTQTAMQRLEAKRAELEALHPYKVRGKPETYSDYNQGWEDALSILGDCLTELLPVEREQIDTARREGYAEGQKDAISDRYFQDRER